MHLYRPLTLASTMLGESYQLAKSFKELSDKLSRFATIVYDLEVGKKQAADAKDYDEAERIKVRKKAKIT